MDSLFVGWDSQGGASSALVLAAQFVAEINRRWNWTSSPCGHGGIAATRGSMGPRWWAGSVQYAIMFDRHHDSTVLLATRNSPVRHTSMRSGWVALWIGLAVNIMEASIRDLTIYFSADAYLRVAVLKGVTRTPST